MPHCLDLVQLAIVSKYYTTRLRFDISLLRILRFRKDRHIQARLRVDVCQLPRRWDPSSRTSRLGSNHGHTAPSLAFKHNNGQQHEKYVVGGYKRSNIWWVEKDEMIRQGSAGGERLRSRARDVHLRSRQSNKDQVSVSAVIRWHVAGERLNGANTWTSRGLPIWERS